MERNLEVQTPAGAKKAVKLVGFPDECPRCHTKIVPLARQAVATSTDLQGNVEEAFHCTNGRCQGLFIGIYRYNSGTMNPPRYDFVRAIPLTALAPAVSDEVRGLSAPFLKTYTQALAAEAAGLDQLTGIGLRKALEFLVKDFPIQQHPGEAEDIRKKMLGPTIQQYVEDPNLKATAGRAAWLGNDETHYVRLWEDKDIADLKVLIRLTMNWVENVLLTQKYVREMPEGKKA
jgi:hypothetical protein